VTVRNLTIVAVDAEENILLVKGAVPGPNGGYVVVPQSEEEVAAMPIVDIVDLGTTKFGEVELADSVFGAAIKRASTVRVGEELHGRTALWYGENEGAPRSGRFR